MIPREWQPDGDVFVRAVFPTIMDGRVVRWREGAAESFGHNRLEISASRNGVMIGHSFVISSPAVLAEYKRVIDDAWREAVSMGVRVFEEAE